MTATIEATATRQHIAYPVVRAETKFGEVEITFNGPASLVLHTSHGHRGPCPIIEVRGVQYSINIHMRQGAEGWQVSGETPFEQHQYAHIARTDWVSRGEPSSAARKAIVAEAVATANRVVSETPDNFRLAELANINNDLMTLDRKIAEAQAALDAMNEDAAQKRAREAVLTLA
jgi:hypothetical protein